MIMSHTHCADDTPYGSPRPSLELLSHADLLIWDDDRIGVCMTLDEEKVGAIKSEWVQPLLVKLIKTVMRDRERIERLEEEVSFLRCDPKRVRQSKGGPFCRACPAKSRGKGAAFFAYIRGLVPRRTRRRRRRRSPRSKQRPSPRAMLIPQQIRVWQGSIPYISNKHLAA